MVLVTYTLYQLQPLSHSAANYPPEIETWLCHFLAYNPSETSRLWDQAPDSALHDPAPAWPFISIACQGSRLTPVSTPSARSAKYSP